MAERAMHKEQRSRESVLYRDCQNESKRVTRFDLRPSDQASYQEHRVTVESTKGHAPDAPITAGIRFANGTTKNVKYEALRPLGSHRKQHTIPRESNVKVGDFIFYEEEGGTFTGKVTGVQEESCTVHDWGPKRGNGKKYLPLWIVHAGKPPQHGPEKQPKGSKPHLTTVTSTALLFVGELLPTNWLSEETMDMAVARGIGMDFQD
jgi:hypothetical protein